MSQRLVFTTTSLHNVVISNASDVLYYEVVTPKWERHSTKISRLDPVAHQFHLIAEFQNVDDKPVMMNMYSTFFRPVEEFLRKNETQILASFRGKDGKTYTWRVRDTGPELVLEDEPGSKPLATYHRQKRHLYVLLISQHPYIEVEPDALDTLDSLICAHPVLWHAQHFL
ncbi:hypothetical protein OBBRIDRAFT_734857 [Obba rivulosa]|uniref:DUF6593 domain-containing protein n=1 Tax=Obba rivulosa TaxID=1052685 RepID=A0A8E2DHI5_9APHY|nr:hypothetical protein OBBRIDRAFT_734857 [Obba rivulosa]